MKNSATAILVAFISITGTFAAYKSGLGPEQNPEPLDNDPLIQVFAIPADPPEDPRVPSSPPTMFIHENRLFYTDGQSGPLRAYELPSLSPLWSQPVPWHEMRFVAAKDDILYIRTLNNRSAKGDLVALDGATGKIIWSTSIGNYGRDDSGRIAVFTKNQLLLCGWDTLTAFDIQTGAKRFAYRYNYDQSLLSHDSMPQTKDPKYATTERILWGIDDQLLCIKPSDGSIYWQFSVCGDIRPENTADGYAGLGHEILKASETKVLYLFASRATGTILFCIDVANKKVHWQHANVQSFVRHGNQVYISQERGPGKRGIYCLDLDSGNVRWKHEIPHSRISRCVVSGNLLYCIERWIDTDSSLQSRVHALKRDTGTLAWQHTFTGWVTSDPIPYKGRLYVVSPKEGERDHHGVIRIYADKEHR